MKNDINTKARIAFATLVLVSTSAGAIWYFYSASQYVTYQIATRDSVSGLMADAPVEFHGVEVGKVKSVALTSPHSVKILLSVDRAAPITAASVATITSGGLATRGFSGYVYIAIEDVGSDSRPLARRPGERYPVIAAAPSRLITLDTTLDQVNQNVRAATELLQSIFDRKTIVSLQQSADNLQQVTKTLAENTRKLNAIIAHTEQASRRFGPLLDSSHDAIRTLQGQTLPQLHQAISNLDTLLDSSHDTMSAFEMEILPQTHQVLSDLEGLSTPLTGFATRLNRDPSILIRGAAPRPLGPGEEK
jgi:phospholipid/cholesterol/gamma-HCH transport system substrate-binding protein